jgi:holo-[acyl-carrier protein] synthase
MPNRETVLSIVSSLSGVAPEQIAESTLLDQIKLRGSIKRARLDAALRKASGHSIPAAYSAKTFGELVSAALGLGSTPASASAPAPAPAKTESPAAPQPAPGARPFSGPLACGIDLELVENLPVAADFWEDPFYAANFTPAEIAYCSLQTEPRVHFTARWAAKEALKKCDNSLLQEPMNQIEFARSTSGEAYFNRLAAASYPGALSALPPLPHIASLSHSDTFAVAVVVLPPATANKNEILSLVAGKLAAALPR